jgi:GNAT superfamily N-acetyltransferase
MLTLREPRPQDAETLGRICYDAFGAISDAHNFPRDFPSPEVATGLMTMMIANPGFFGAVAEDDGRIVGSNFLDERSAIFGVGPITVDPRIQNKGVGRRLMQAVLDRTAERGAPGVRLLQAGYHSRSLSLYAGLGFDVREHVACMSGPAIAAGPPGVRARVATTADEEACNHLCRRVHGHDRSGELTQAVGQGTAMVAERAGRITGYASHVAYFGHSVGETSDDVKALIAATGEVGPPGILVPSRNGGLFRWCLANGLLVTQTLTLMTRGLYNEPAGAWMPSVLY